jgi:hypothetical protein
MRTIGGKHKPDKQPDEVSHIILISAVGVVEVAQHVELIRLEGGAGLIDKVIRPRHLNGLAINRLR